MRRSTQGKIADTRKWIVVGIIAIILAGAYFFRTANRVVIDDPADSSDLDQMGKPGEVIEAPWISSPELVGRGKVVYDKACAVCHGKEGRGNGPASSGLVPPPRDLVEGRWKQGGTSKELFVTMEMGIPGTSMIGFAHFSLLLRWALVHYIRSITDNKPEDDLNELEKFAQSVE